VTSAVTPQVVDPVSALAGALGVGIGYALRSDGGWLHLDPLDAGPLPQQGWKLHVSAGVPDAVETLQRVAQVVMPYRLHFKVANSIKQLIALCGPPTPVSQVGKFITIYVEDDDQLAPLAEQLHLTTRDFQAPIVPSDRRYRRGSNVYLRYGGFTARASYANQDQAREFYIVDPSGRRMTDLRRPGQYRPEWVPEPGVPPKYVAHRSGPGLFGRDIQVRTVLQQSAKGGVFRARWNSHDVVVKEARLGTCPDLMGRDSRSRLRNEWRLLQRLRGTGLAPEPLGYFVEDANAYLVEQFLPGVSLRRLITDMNYLGDPDIHLLLTYCSAVTDLVAAVRQHGVLPRDLTPNNILVHEGRFSLVDLELGELADSPAPPFDGWTPGYARARPGRMADAGDIDFAVAAIKHFILTGIDPYLGHADDITSHIDGLLDAFAPRGVSGLEPELKFVRRQLGNVLQPGGIVTPSPDRIAEEAVEAGLELVHRVDWGSRSWPWPKEWSSALFHPACFHTGTAGVARYYLDLWQATGDRQWVAHADDLLSWTSAHHPLVQGETPTGLHFGMAALPGLLAETAAHSDLLRVPLLRARAEELSDALASVETNSWDITHGMAGMGLGQLAMLTARAGEADRGRLDTVGRVAASLLARAEERDGLLVWLRDTQYSYGYAHGSAGIGYFLLRAAQALHVPALYQAAISIARALVPLGVSTASGAGLSWRSGPTGPDVPWTHWCNGAAGVGSFLLAAAAATDDQQLWATARQAGRAISRGRAYGSCGRCHGLAGDGYYLLQLGYADENEEFIGAAHGIGKRLEALKIRRGPAWKWPDESGGEPRPAYMRGYLGVHAFRLQLAGLLPVTPRNF
jgi:tRNA A-37 threonylcarbamoyl transferase component Bud32/mono/diheme cytochrome c family protein